jgi:hypothetical protein
METKLKSRLKSLLLLPLLLLVLTGCRKPSPPEVRGLSQLATSAGLALAKVDTKTREQIKSAIHDDVLPYLNGQVGVSTLAFDIAMKARLTAKLKPEVVLIISGATYVLDSVLPAPGPDTFVNAEYLEYMRQFFQGVEDGCTITTRDPRAEKYANKRGKWFR